MNNRLQAVTLFGLHALHVLIAQDVRFKYLNFECRVPLRTAA